MARMGAPLGHQNRLRHGHNVRGKMTRTYKSWSQMIQRCTNPKNPDYKDYGGRGIVVHSEWRVDFASFLTDMGECDLGLSLDRKDTNGPYTPSNCRWATVAVQANNRRNNRLLHHDGETLTLSQWARKVGLSRKVISDRIHKLGWPVSLALTKAHRYA
jgi:hypothetical protein